MESVSMIASPSVLLQGAVAGLLFGFLLQRGGVTRFETIVGQFLLRDFTVLKVMGTAIVVGAVGVYGMIQLGLLEGVSVKAATLYTNALGGAIFALGMVILGYCPGTGVGAAFEGAKDARWGLLGMLIGAALYSEAHSYLTSSLAGALDLGKATFVSLSGLSPWWFIALVAIGAIVGFSALERFEKSRA